VFESATAFALGAILVDAPRGRVFVTDGTSTGSPSLRVFGSTAGALTATGTIGSNPSQKLPPRGLAWY